jgi:hypothetical protein
MVLINTSMPNNLRSTLQDRLRAVIGDRVQQTKSQEKGESYTFEATHLTYYNRMSTDVHFYHFSNSNV